MRWRRGELFNLFNFLNLVSDADSFNFLPVFDEKPIVKL